MNSVFKLQRSSLPISQQRNPFLSLQREMDKAMNEFYELFSGQKYDIGTFEGLRISPRVDIIDTKDSFKVECELPGLSEEDVKVSIADGLLSLKAEKSASKLDKDKNYLAREISYGSYERNITLPDTVDINKAKATFKKGMLWIDIPKKAGTVQNLRELKVERTKE